MTDREHRQEAVAPLLRAAFGAQATQILYVAAKLAIADHLQNGRQSATELAKILEVDSAALQRVLRGLVNLGACDEIDGGHFGLTKLGQYLRTDHADSLQSRIILNSEVHCALWADLLATVRTGESASQRVFGMPFFEHLSRNPAVGSVFDRAMTSAGWVRHRFRPAVDAYDFGQFKTIVDVGGGNGTLMVELLRKYPQPIGTIFDLPRLADTARQTIEAAGLSARCQFVAGNAFEAVPPGADAYLLSNFVINWGDEEAVKPLRNCRKVIAEGGKLLLVEWMIPTADEATEEFRYWDTVTMDLVMLAAFGSRSGHVRTRSEFQALLAAAGFTLAAVVPTRAAVCVIEAVPV